MKLLRYAWAFPVTSLGLLAALLTLGTGGEVRRSAGTLEVHGGFARWFLRRLVGAQAMTLGHVILGVAPWALDAYRQHERAHVRQCEQWGIFFLPVYLLASLWAALQGRHYYRDNWFEVDAERSERAAGTSPFPPS
ncbi:MAG TPA: hypothetical protein VGR07_03815 [Thermoanaerobaculia bacterium]|jgi:hypothetical protein|nr:hypothetical protein [Thermoanaerobaculia bacterium]